MEFYETLDQAVHLLRSRGRVPYRALRLQFHLDDDHLEALKDELIKAQHLAMDEDGAVLVWAGEATPAPPPATAKVQAPPVPIPAHLGEKILASRAALEGERKQVTVLFVDIKDSTRLTEGLDPEASRQLLDPAMHLMMDAVHRYEGTVNQVLGDGSMALFGAPIAHEDHALRACYAALAMQAALRRYGDEVRRAQGLTLHTRVGLNSGEVVVRTISNDLHDEALQIAEAVDRPIERLRVYARVGPLHVRQGTLHTAIPPLERVVALSQDANIPLLYRIAASYLALAYALAGRATDALAVLGQVGGKTDLPHLHAALACGEAYLRAGGVEEAHRLAQRVLAHVRDRKMRGEEVWALWLLGEIAMRRDPPDVEQAEAHYQQALALAEELGMRPLQVYCHLGLGTLYATSRQQEQARAALSAAITLYRAMDMTFWLPQAEAAPVQAEDRP